MMLLAPVLFAAVQAASFAPPLAQPLRVVTERTGNGSEGSRQRIERIVTFHRAAGGYRAEVVLVKAEASGTADAQAMFQAGYSGLAGRTLVFHIDPAGKVTAIADLADHWKAYCHGISAMIAARPSKRPAAEMAMLADRIAAPICALPPERQRSALASLVEVLVADPADMIAGSTAVRVPGKSPLGGPATLSGTRTVDASGTHFHSVTNAAADVAVAAEGSAPARSAHVEILREIVVDPLSGMVAQSSESVRSTVGGGAPSHHRTRIIVTYDRPGN